MWVKLSTKRKYSTFKISWHWLNEWMNEYYNLFVFCKLTNVCKGFNRRFSRPAQNTNIDPHENIIFTYFSQFQANLLPNFANIYPRKITTQSKIANIYQFTVSTFFLYSWGITNFADKFVNIVVNFCVFLPYLFLIFLTFISFQSHLFQSNLLYWQVHVGIHKHILTYHIHCKPNYLHALLDLYVVGLYMW